MPDRPPRQLVFAAQPDIIELSGLTLAQVGERTGLSISHVSRLETGKRPQSVEDVATLLVVYGVTGPERGDLTAFVGEAALRNPIGGKEVLYEQLRYLVEVAERGNVVIQVMPAATGGHPGLDGSFLRLRFPDRPAVVFVGCLCSSVYMEDRLEIAMFDRIVSTLRERALSEENSVRLIAELAANLEFSVA